MSRSVETGAFPPNTPERPLLTCGEREAQICPALMATSCCDAHEGTAGGAEFGAGLFVSAAEGAAQDALQFL